MKRFDQAVSEWISKNILAEDLVVEVIATVRERLSARAKVTPSDAPKLEKEADRLRKEIDRLVTTSILVVLRSLRKALQ